MRRRNKKHWLAVFSCMQNVEAQRLTEAGRNFPTTALVQW